MLTTDPTEKPDDHLSYTTRKGITDIRRRARKQQSAEEKIRSMLEGLRGKDSIAEPCRRGGIATRLFYSPSKGFLG